MWWVDWWPIKWHWSATGEARVVSTPSAKGHYGRLFVVIISCTLNYFIQGLFMSKVRCTVISFQVLTHWYLTTFLNCLFLLYPLIVCDHLWLSTVSACMIGGRDCLSSEEWKLIAPIPNTTWIVCDRKSMDAFKRCQIKNTVNGSLRISLRCKKICRSLFIFCFLFECYFVLHVSAVWATSRFSVVAV